MTANCFNDAAKTLLERLPGEASEVRARPGACRIEPATTWESAQLQSGLRTQVWSNRPLQRSSVGAGKLTA